MGNLLEVGPPRVCGEEILHHGYLEGSVANLGALVAPDALARRDEVIIRLALQQLLHVVVQEVEVLVIEGVGVVRRGANGLHDLRVLEQLVPGLLHDGDVHGTCPLAAAALDANVGLDVDTVVRHLVQQRQEASQGAVVLAPHPGLVGVGHVGEAHEEQ